MKTLFTVSLLDLDVTGLPGKNTYVVAQIGPRQFGRSRRVPEGSTKFDFGGEPIPWSAEVLVDGDTLPLSVSLWEDAIDDGSSVISGTSVDLVAPPIETVVELGARPGVRVKVSARELPSAPTVVYVPRTPAGESRQATLRIPDTLVVELASIRGLYRPVATGQPGRRRSTRIPGYRSEDNLGRVYLNHGLDGEWKREQQAIELTARLVPVRGIVPPRCKLRWSWFDVDDPTDADPGLHAEWRSYVDPGDYEHATGMPKGSAGKDNEKPRKARPAKNPPWEEVPGYAVSSAKADTALTLVEGGESKIMLHCPAVAGANLVVRVDVEPMDGLESFGAETGTMTMWHRLDVENIRMQSAFVIPIDQIPPRFEPMCVQLDFAEERIIPDQWYLSPDEELQSVRTSEFIDTVFVKRSEPGWFCVVAALYPYYVPHRPVDPVGIEPAPLRGRLGVEGVGANTREFVDVEGILDDPYSVTVDDGHASVTFRVASIKATTDAGVPTTRLYLRPHDVHPDFTAGDGSWEKAHESTFLHGPSRTHLADGSVRAGGYRLREAVEVTLPGGGQENYAIGISPYVERGGTSYFAGRTCMFTHHFAYLDAKTGKPNDRFADYFVTVITHELVHAFGMPHKCGHFDFRAPRANTCCMNYGSGWMVDKNRDLVAGTSGRCGVDVCGRHMQEIRRVRLLDNKGLAW